MSTKFRVALAQSGLSFDSDQGEHLLESALKANIHLEHSCKTGDCGTCSATLIDGHVESSGQKIEPGNEFLTCKSVALSHVTIEADYVPELADIQTKTLPIKVKRYRQVADDIIELVFRMSPKVQFKYLAGQYVNLIFNGIARAYSIANAQNQQHELHLHLRLLDQGAMSDLLREPVPENALMRVYGPLGTFFVRQNDRPILFLAGGTGYAPIQAMIQQLLIDQDQRPIYFYWGMADPSSFYSEQPQTWADQYSHIQFVPVVSGPVNQEASTGLNESKLSKSKWQGRQGFVHQAVLDDFSDLSGFDVYACGSPALIDAAKTTFITQGLDAKAFYADAFLPSIASESIENTSS